MRRTPSAWACVACPLVFWGLANAGLVHATEIADTIDRVKPSIVAVGTLKLTNNPSFAFRGTGFVVGDGTYVATNAHVTAGAVDMAGGTLLAVQVRTASGLQVRNAQPLAISTEYDLAVLKFDGSPLPTLTLRDSGSIREGLAIGFTGFPIGNALGFSPVTHRGMISAITPIALPGATANQLNEKLVRRLRAGTFNILQLDATAYPGNSGSPVFDAQNGEVVGIINMVLVKSTKESALSQPTGITYAIPVSYLADLLRAAR